MIQLTDADLVTPPVIYEFAPRSDISAIELLYALYVNGIISTNPLTEEQTKEFSLTESKHWRKRTSKVSTKPIELQDID